MLVTLGNNVTVGANSPITLPYSCTSVQKVFVRIEDNASWNSFVTIQIGSKTIMNSVSMWGLTGLNRLQNGFVASDSVRYACIDLGSYELTDNQQLYVTVGASQELTAVDVSAVVNTPCESMPLRYTEYSDNVFTATNVLGSIIYASGTQAIDEITSNVELRTSLYSSAPSIVSSVSYYLANEISTGDGVASYYGLLSQNKMPLDTSFNYPSGLNANRILCVQAEPVTRSQIAQARKSQAIAKAVK